MNAKSLNVLSFLYTIIPNKLAEQVCVTTTAF